MKTRKGQQNDNQHNQALVDELREELRELDAQRDAIEDRLSEVRRQLEGHLDPEEVVAHEGAGSSDAAREAEEWREKYYRSLADFQNYQRRSVQNEAEARRQGVVSVVEKLISVVDNFQLALQVDPDKTSARQIHQGVSVIRDEMMRIMKNLDVQEIRAEPNDEFNPGWHEAMMQTAAEGIDPGHVVMMLQSGYRLGDRVLRPAKVSVALQSEPEPATNQSSEPEDDGTRIVIDEVSEEDLPTEES